jgi:hypothetical protein
MSGTGGYHPHAVEIRDPRHVACFGCRPDCVRRSLQKTEFIMALAGKLEQFTEQARDFLCGHLYDR